MFVGCSIRLDFPGCRRHRPRWASWNFVRQERPLFDGKGFQSASDRSYTSRHHPLGRGNLAFGVKCAVALVCTRWQAVFLRPSDPADLVLIASFASWTCVFHRPRFGPLRVEISLFHSHIIFPLFTFGEVPGICALVFICSRV